MKCEETQAAFLSGEATQKDLDHVSSCLKCRDQWEVMDATRQILDDPGFWEPPSDGLEQQVVALISGAPNAAPVEDRSRRRWIVMATAAAAVVIGLIGWMGVRTPAPDWEITLPGTDEAPGAMGIVQGWVEPGGTRLALDVVGMPAAPDGFVYEFWFSRDAQHISAGTFAVPDHVDLWVGVLRADYPRMWITLEPLDEDESLSGINVMDTG